MTLDKADSKPAQKQAPDENNGENLNDTREIGGRKGPDPVRYGDWELNGKCVDF